MHTLQTHCKSSHTHTHTPHTPVTADIIINNGGTMGSGATIANTSQRLGVFTVHELDVTRLTAAAAAAAGPHSLLDSFTYKYMID